MAGKVIKLPKNLGDGMLGRLGVDGFEADPWKELPGDPWEFALECCITLDEARAGSGKSVRRRFPDYDYLRDIVQVVDENPFNWIHKSGQLTVSWALQAYFLWAVLVNRGYRLAYYCLSQTKAEGHIQSRFWRLYQSIPLDYRPPHAEFKLGQLQVFHDGEGTLPTSYIIPMAAEQGKQGKRDGEASAAAKMRSETWTRALLDESAFYPNLEELHNSLLPRVGGITHVSTPNGHNFYERVGLGSVQDAKKLCVSIATVGVRDVRKGVKIWERNGFSCLSALYPAHPDRDPETKNGAEWVRVGKLRSTTRLWNREQEGSFDVSAGAPVWECESMTLEDGSYRLGLIIKKQIFQVGHYLLRGWDFGHRYPAVVFGQIDEIRDDHGKIHRTLLRMLWEYTLEGSTTEDLCRMVKSHTVKRFQNAETRDYCDFYGGHQVRSTGPKSDVEILRSNGIHPISTAVQIKIGVELIQKLIVNEMLEIDPEGCPLLLTGMRSGYVRGDGGEMPTEREKEGQHPYCDYADAFRYMAYHAFRFLPVMSNPATVRDRPTSIITPGQDAVDRSRSAGNVSRVDPFRKQGRRLSDPNSRPNVWRPQRAPEPGIAKRPGR